jgi:hypothetical protein
MWPHLHFFWMVFSRQIRWIKLLISRKWGGIAFIWICKVGWVLLTDNTRLTPLLQAVDRIQDKQILYTGRFLRQAVVGRKSQPIHNYLWTFSDLQFSPLKSAAVLICQITGILYTKCHVCSQSHVSWQIGQCPFSLFEELWGTGWLFLIWST